MKIDTRAGLTMIDTLIVAIVLALFTGLAMPLLIQMRADARSTECASRMRKLTIATHYYHDAYRRLPPATLAYDWVEDFERWSEDESSKSSWQKTQNSSSLLLVIHYSGVDDPPEGIHQVATDVSTTLVEHNNRSAEKFSWQGDITGLDDARSTWFDELLCPEDRLREVEVRPVIATQPCQPFDQQEMDSRDECRDIAIRYWDVEEAPVALTNFVACLGVVGESWSDNPELRRWRGAMTPRVRNTLERISDGTSRTLMYGESLGEIVEGERRSAMSWLWGGGGRITGNWPFDSLDRGDDEEVPMLGNGQYASVAGFGTLHEDGIAFSLCDGSVRRIDIDINRQTLFELAGSADGGIPLHFLP